MTGIHSLIYRKTKGKRMGTFSGMPILVLHTKGRKSGKHRKTPLMYFMNNGSYVITASNGGSNKHPGWYFNLTAESESDIRTEKETEIEVAGELVKVKVNIASAEEKTPLWPLLVAQASFYEGYQNKTSREIPMVLLTPLN